MADEEFSNEAKEAILAYDRAAAEDVARRALAAGISPGEIMASGFIPGIQELGDLFESGEVFLPELMMAAQAMEGATMICNAALEGAAAEAKGKVVIGTVQGDVHDIGKAIVIAYLKANGFEVTDLGRDVSAEMFITKATEVGADVIGMSALLTTTMEEQRKVAKRVKEENLPFKVVVGGAPCTQRWADQIGADAYAEDANDGVKKIGALLGK
ncbi:MAG: B12-binding domain-containing protein [Thermoleophilia bacterium]